MNNPARTLLRAARYAAPGLFGRALPAPGPRAAARRCCRLQAKGLVTTAGYFQADDDLPETIVEANVALAALLAGNAAAYISVKAPPLGFDRGAIATIAEAAAGAGLRLLFDAHAAKDAQATQDIVLGLLERHPGTGLAVPARWRRSAADIARFRDTSASIRLVKGEWADPDWPDPDVAAAYLALVSQLAGRTAPVAVATHDPALAHEALTRLRDAGTPCELEQLRGLPSRRTIAVARRLGVPVRIYVPYGPGWWPYAINQALARPYLPAWFLRDAAAGLGRP